MLRTRRRLEAAQRPTMRFVAVKSVGNQAAAVILRTRDLLVRQRTQLFNAVRGHMGDGLVVPQGASQAARPIATVADPRMRRSLRPRDRRCAPWCPPLRGLKSRPAALRRRSPAALGKMRPLAADRKRAHQRAPATQGAHGSRLRLAALARSRRWRWRF